MLVDSTSPSIQFDHDDSPSTKPLLMDENNRQSLSTIPTTVALQEYKETVNEVAINKKKRISNIERWILLAGVLILIITIVILILILNKVILVSKSSLTNNGGKKVLFIIADGIPADTMESATVPNIRKIQQIGTYKRAYVGGDIGTYTETHTISAPGYMNLLTSTWGNKHNVYDNGVNNPNYNYKNIFRLNKEQQPHEKIGIFSTWIDNRIKLIGEGLSKAGNIKFDFKFDGYELDLINYPHDSEKLFVHHIDQRVIKETSECIKNNAPDLSWVYLQYTDDVAHMHGDSVQMYQAVNILDQQIGQIYESIEYRMKQYQEDWLIIITTDHGRDPKTGHDHGEQSERERTTWIIMNKKETNNYFQNFQPAIVDIMPSMARFMNLKIPIESERELDGVPFFGNVSLAKPTLYLNRNNLTINWKALDSTGNIQIWLSITNRFKDGLVDDYKLLGSVPIVNQQAAFDLQNYPSQFYKVLLEGQYNMVNRWITRS